MFVTQVRDWCAFQEVKSKNCDPLLRRETLPDFLGHDQTSARNSTLFERAVWPIPTEARHRPLRFEPMMGAELRKLRERAGLTQEQLSFRADLSRPYISQLEQNHKSPTVDTLFRICDALDASAADLVRRVDAARKRKPGR